MKTAKQRLLELAKDNLKFAQLIVDAIKFTNTHSEYEKFINSRFSDIKSIIYSIEWIETEQGWDYWEFLYKRVAGKTKEQKIEEIELSGFGSITYS